MIDYADFARMLGHERVGLYTIGQLALDIDAPNLNFQDIPQNYAALLLVARLRANDNVTSRGASLRINNDSGNNYDTQTLFGAAGTPNAGEGFAQSSIGLRSMPGGSTTAGLASIHMVLFLDYARTAFQKAALILNSHKVGTASGNIEVSAVAAHWRSTNAINQLTVFAGTGNLAPYSMAVLYGIGNAG